jgi:hypothetical protein
VDVARVRYFVRVSRAVSDTMTRRDRVPVWSADPVHLVPAGIVGVMSPAVTARKAEECHGGHAGGSENHAEDVEVHLYGR